MKILDEALQKGTCTTENAISLFDQLESPDINFMLGPWKGYGFPTHHFLDGLLEAFGWYGKVFKNTEAVHPLLFYKANKKGVFAVNPGLLQLKALFLPIPKNWLLRVSLLGGKAVLQTQKSKARLRMMEYRDKISAVMVYDNQPIIDVFRRIDEDTVLGMMDFKKMSKPFFFVLKRDKAFPFSLAFSQ